MQAVSFIVQRFNAHDFSQPLFTFSMLIGLTVTKNYVRHTKYEYNRPIHTVS